MKRSFRPLLVAASFALMAQPGSAQVAVSGQAGTVSANGTVTITKQPERMRLKIDLLAKAGSLDDSLAQLEDRKEAAVAQVRLLGADEGSISIDPPKITSTKTDRQRQMEMMLAQRLRGGGRRQAGSDKPSEPIALSATLTAEWVVAAETAQDLLRTVYQLQTSIKEADLSGMREATQLTPAEQELLEEAESQGYYYGDGDESKPGEPVFLFVGRVSQQERNQAMAQAFQKARAEAEMVAQAAGAKLGTLSSLSSHDGPASDYDDFGGYYGYSSTVRQMLAQASGGDSGGSEEKEAVAAQAGPLKYTVTVSAAFRLDDAP